MTDELKDRRNSVAIESMGAEIKEVIVNYSAEHEMTYAAITGTLLFVLFGELMEWWEQVDE